MPRFCCNTTVKKIRRNCPACGQTCFPVDTQTMLHQIRFPDNQHIADDDYAFCSNHDCMIGYFSSSDTVEKSRLRTFQLGREPMLCHCFDISEAVYRSALADGTAAAIKTFVIAQTKKSLCACESRNPSGRCCLADFRAMEKEDACDC